MHLKLLPPHQGGLLKDFIITQTSKKYSIKNSQNLSPLNPILAQHQISEQKKNFFPAVFRGGYSDIYNCHGMTFACRRTGIEEVSEIQKILNDDSYIPLKMSEVIPGDIVLYCAPDNDIEHSGIVVQAPVEGLPHPLILSKWGALSEVVHSLYLCPYPGTEPKFFRCKL